MKTRDLVFRIFKACIAIAIAMVICMFVYRTASKAYDFGFRIFSEEPMTAEPGYTMSVAIVEGKSAMEIGEILEDKGLIESAYLFYIQEKLSDYHDKLQPGIYELSTAMTPEEMMAIMASESDTIVEGEEEYETAVSSDAQDALGAGDGSDVVEDIISQDGAGDAGVTEGGE